MGRRKIEIKAIKDDRNRSVTFLKRKGGLFKKAHELSVLCSVDVAVFIFGNNKKLYEYSSSDMPSLITRYQYHGGPQEHKGPADFNGRNDDEDEDDGDATPPRAHDSMEPQMMPPHFSQQQQYQHVRHVTPSASPPIPNGAIPYQGGHPAHQRGHTPQPHGSRPGSRNNMRPHMGPAMVPQPAGPQGPHPGITYMPTPPIYNPPTSQPGMMPNGAQYQYAPAPGQYPEVDRRQSAPPGYATQPQHIMQVPGHHEPSPPQPQPQHLPQHPPQHVPQHVPHMSPPPQRPMEAQAPPRSDPTERPARPGLDTESIFRKMPQRKSHSIFTPIEDNRGSLTKHALAFAGESPNVKVEPAARAQSIDAGALTRNGQGAPPPLQRALSSVDKSRQGPPVPETTFTAPSRSNSLQSTASSRPRGPRLTVQIPDGGSEPSESAGVEGQSPMNQRDTTAQLPPGRSGMVLPPPSPSASALLSAGATGPPNPFARPPPQQSVNETPVSALPSRFINHELMPSPGTFESYWGISGRDSNTLPSPSTFLATPLATNGPSFLRDDHPSSNPMGSTAGPAPSTAATGHTVLGGSKRKSPDYGAGPDYGRESSAEAKRIKMERPISVDMP